MLKEAVNLPCPFAEQERADRVHETAAGFYQLRAYVEQPLLKRDDTVEALGCQPPASFGIAPPRAASRTGRVNEDEVRAFPPIRELLQFMRRIKQQRLNGRAGTLRSRCKLRQPDPVAVRRENVGLWRCRRERQRLAARASTQVHHSIACLRLTSERDQLTALVLNLDEAKLER